MTTKQYILKRIEERWIGRTIRISDLTKETIKDDLIVYELPPTTTATKFKASEVYKNIQRLII